MKNYNQTKIRIKGKIMGINESIVLTSGLDIEDVKAILLYRGEIVSIEVHNEFVVKYGEYLAICALASVGNEKARRYLVDKSVDNFHEAIFGDTQDIVLNHSQALLDSFYPDDEKIDEVE